ncbi:hypothetical protein I7I51_06639 [Histoplasma capsulatum]|uniref:Uncharacterized protein n=1 Tax=Ajellomyces capsulatus TaxID=5037 RepID=A0A8A1MKY1_AJECA|nr:hypothetical protein I7I51_06639 [Histoplasma capsulatum]
MANGDAYPLVYISTRSQHARHPSMRSITYFFSNPSGLDLSIFTGLRHILAVLGSKGMSCGTSKMHDELHMKEMIRMSLEAVANQRSATLRRQYPLRTSRHGYFQSPISSKSRTLHGTQMRQANDKLN